MMQVEPPVAQELQAKRRVTPRLQERMRQNPAGLQEPRLVRLCQQGPRHRVRCRPVLVGGFQSAEDTVGKFVKTGKLDFGDLVTSVLADLAKLAVRKSVLGPIADMLSGALGGIGGAFAPVLHSGGIVGSTNSGRMIAALAFAGAPRMHSGGWVGLRPDEVPAIPQKGKRVLSRRGLAAQGGSQQGNGGQNIAVTINARDAQSFPQPRVQVASDIARAVAFGRRAF